MNGDVEKAAQRLANALAQCFARSSLSQDEQAAVLEALVDHMKEALRQATAAALTRQRIRDAQGAGPTDEQLLSNDEGCGENG